MYLEKLHPDVDILWQRPKAKLINLEHEWYDAAPVGRDPLNSKMKQLSTKAALSMIYTNHCIWASVVTNLNESGFEACDIMATTGHKSESSIRSYAKKCPVKRRREMSDILASKIVEKQHKSDQNEEQKVVKQQNDTGTFEIFPDFEDEDLVKVLTQIEKENEKDINQPELDQQVAVHSPKDQKTINFSALTNISNVNRNPVLPHLYFPTQMSQLTTIFPSEYH